MQLKRFRTKLKEHVMNETIPIIKIYEEEVISSQVPPQTLSIMPLARDLHFPYTFSILPNRKKYICLEMFQELKRLVVQLNQTCPSSRILTNYEPSIIGAISTEFSDAIHNGCYFHFTQAVYRHAQDLGLTTTYVADTDIHTCIRKRMALALLPLDKIQIVFDDLRRNSSDNVKQILYQLFLYFENQ
ncbi:unnamed protein product [Rotaria sp. Silwood2]|nr:unnamed protein product [Rotaria sp. Silwood2]CAF4017101.1 unnamed protein product [Rotaria sp. Silwood2]CAF4130095.1 unnamed protein product [Rotaria sp. Silwood2]